jgi:hypothetical protein
MADQEAQEAQGAQGAQEAQESQAIPNPRPQPITQDRHRTSTIQRRMDYVYRFASGSYPLHGVRIRRPFISALVLRGENRQFSQAYAQRTYPTREDPLYHPFPSLQVAQQATQQQPLRSNVPGNELSSGNVHGCDVSSCSASSGNLPSSS